MKQLSALKYFLFQKKKKIIIQKLDVRIPVPNFNTIQKKPVLDGVVEGQKKTQNDKKFCLSHSVSQELYMIVIFGTCVKW